LRWETQEPPEGGPRNHILHTKQRWLKRRASLR